MRHLKNGHQENVIHYIKHRSKKCQEQKKTTKRKNIVGNFRGSEDIFWTSVVKGFKKFLESPFK